VHALSGSDQIGAAGMEKPTGFAVKPCQTSNANPQINPTGKPDTKNHSRRNDGCGALKMGHKNLC